MNMSIVFDGLVNNLDYVANKHYSINVIYYWYIARILNVFYF